MKRLISVLVVALALFAQQKAEHRPGLRAVEDVHGDSPRNRGGDVAGPAGRLEADRHVQVEHFGLMQLSGTVEGNKVSLKIEVQGGQVTIGITGTVDGGKMTGTTELGGNWSANRETASR